MVEREKKCRTVRNRSNLKDQQLKYTLTHTYSGIYLLPFCSLFFSCFFSFFPPPSLLSFFLCVSLTLLFPLIQEFHPPLCSSLTYNITIFQPPKTIYFLGSVSLCLIFSLRWFPNSHLYFKILKIHVQQLSFKITKRVNCFFQFCFAALFRRLKDNCGFYSLPANPERLRLKENDMVDQPPGLISVSI